MNKFLLRVVMVGLLVICASASMVSAQQQQSGGQSVTVTNFPGTQPVSMATNTPDVTDRGARLLGHVTVDGAPTTAVTGPLTDTQMRASAVPMSLAALPSLVAGTAKVGVVYPYTSCGTTPFPMALQAMPTSSTAITTTTTCVLGIDISNTSGSTLTVTISDNQGTPVIWLNAVSMNPGETRTYSWTNGKRFTSGIKVAASSAGITYTLEGLQ